jgi:mevalonate kinase
MATSPHTLNPLETSRQAHGWKTPFRANGKFLLSAEYVVMDGAWALALPLKWGQTLHIEPYQGDFCLIESREANQQVWFKATFHPGTGLVMESNSEAVALKLEQLLAAIPAEIKRQGLKSKKLIFQADFNRNWGLGSSSTLVSLLGQYLEQNPYSLLRQSFGGSGYDIACATALQPILYRLDSPDSPSVQPFSLQPDLLQHMHFFYLGRKAQSAQAIGHYRTLPILERQRAAAEISELSLHMQSNQTLSEWTLALKQHNKILQKLLQQPDPCMAIPGAPGASKPMGAWGGDFMLGLGPAEQWQNFAREMGLQPCWSAQEAMFI